VLIRVLLIINLMTQTQPLVHLVTDEEAKGRAKALFEQLKKSTGKVPKWMRVMANCEDILIGFFTLFKATMDDAPLPGKLKWKVAYKVSELNNCKFCVNAAEMKLKEFGLSDEDIKDLDQASDEREKAALEYAKLATEHAYNIDPAVFAEVKKHFSDEQIVELSSVIGLFNFINRFNDSLGVLPDVE